MKLLISQPLLDREKLASFDQGQQFFEFGVRIRRDRVHDR